MRMARLLTAGDDAFAEDLVQTTLTRLYVAWPRVRRAGNPVGYTRTSLTHALSPTDVVPDTASYDPTRVAGTLPSLPHWPHCLHVSVPSSCSGTGSTWTSPRRRGCCRARPAP